MKILLSALILVSFSTTAFAGAECQKHPKNEWMSVFDMQKKIINDYNYAIKKFKVDGNCYEIYGWKMNEAGKQEKIEVYFDAKTGDIVKSEAH